MVRKFLTHVVPSVVKPMRVLWNEMMAFVFFAIAALPVPKTIKAWREFDSTGNGLFNLALSAAFIVIMASFAIYSVLRARKISRS